MSSTPSPRRPLRLAIWNPVDFHLHVVAGAMRVLAQLSSAPVTVFLTAKVLRQGHFGFMDWLGGTPGFVWRDCAELGEADRGAFDLVWLISPEWDVPGSARTLEQLAPAVPLLYVHNGHMPDEDFAALRALSPSFPLLGMAPHVSGYVAGRLAAAPGRGVGTSEAEWVLPIWPYEPPGLQADDQPALRGFSITGSLDQSLRDYRKVWGQVRAYKQQHGESALGAFGLNLLGAAPPHFAVPADLAGCVALHASPPDAEFYRLIWHSLGLLPALANPAYLTCKLTSAIITSLMTGVPLIADAAFQAAYSVLEPDAIFAQGADESELDVMFRVAQLPAQRV